MWSRFCEILRAYRAGARRIRHVPGRGDKRDIPEVIVGAFHTEEGLAEPAYVKRDDGTYPISG